MIQHFKNFVQTWRWGASKKKTQRYIALRIIFNLSYRERKISDQVNLYSLAGVYTPSFVKREITKGGTMAYENYDHGRHFVPER